MDNTLSQPSLKLPELPTDFEALAGSSRTDFANAIRNWLMGASVEGITQTGPEPYDIAALTQQVKTLQDSVQNTPLVRSVLKAGVTDATLTVDFSDIGTTDYTVFVTPVTPDTNINTVTWSLIENSRTPTQCQIRIDGTGATYNFIITIITNPT